MKTPLGWPTWIGVVVDDLSVQRPFYARTLGFREVESADDWVAFDVDGNRFELLQRTDEPQYDARRYQVGFMVEDIESARRQLVEDGVQPISRLVGPPGERWCYFRDPEGNVFELKEGPRRADQIR